MQRILPSTLSLRKRLRQSAIVRSLYYDFGMANLMVFAGFGDYEKQIDTAFFQFLSKEEQKDINTLKQLRKDIKQCFYKYKTTPSEYFLFKFREKTDKERATYLSDSVIMNEVAKTINRRVHDEELENKYNFYKLNRQFFKREAILVSDEKDYQIFNKIASKRHLIAKPNTGSVGSGIMVFHIQNDADREEAWKKLMEKKSEWIVEELIAQSKEMAVWNESSVNTIRVNSFLHGDKFEVLCPFIRTGRKGSIVDNGGQGGLFASIDPQTGIICTVGMDEHEREYKEHPDTGVKFVGWQVPCWRELMKTSEAVHRNMRNHIYISWDFALSDNGWVLIEGNWGEFVAQQITNKRGFKNDFMQYLYNKR